MIVAALLLSACGACSGSSSSSSNTPSGNPPDAPPPSGPSDAAKASFPLAPVADVDLPGKAVRFDYQDIDAQRGLLVIAHMNDASVVVADVKDGSTKKVLPNVPTARGVICAPEIGRFFVTSSPNQVVIFDADQLSEVARVTSGNGPDGIGWDEAHKVVGVSDQGDGAISLIDGSGQGARQQIKLGSETGNVQFDPTRNIFWITVVGPTAPDQLVAIDPVQKSILQKIPLPGCDGAHGLRIHPDGQSALIACEGNDMLARVDLGGSHAVVTAATGSGPDVLSVDPGLGLVYVAAESGNLVVFDVTKPGLVVADKEMVGAHAHSVAVDPASHRVFFPLLSAPKGTPVLRIMKPVTST
jgi:DNA-binding beta-propeller fold protein YncE